MKVIDLLNKIANGEEVPEKIFYAEQYWINKYPNDYEGLGYGGCLLNNVCLNNLNDEVEILEEPKGIPERVLNAEVFDVPKLNNMELSNIALTNKEDIKIIKDTLNKVLDYLKSKGE